MNPPTKTIDLFMDNLSLVKIVAGKIHKKLPNHVELEDLIVWGNDGLMDAVRKFDPGREIKFRTYAEHRIRGSILDGIRNQDLTPRSVRDFERKVDKARNDFMVTKGRKPNDYELSQMLGLELEDFRKKQTEKVPTAHLSIENFDAFTSDDKKALLVSAQNSSNDMVLKIQAMQKLRLICEGQSPVDRMCFMLYHIWGLTMLEISEMANVTESRISQKIQRMHFRGRSYFKSGL